MTQTVTFNNRVDANFTTLVDRMRLDEVVAFFSQRGYKQTASYFISLANCDCTVFYRNAYWTATSIIKAHLGDRLFQELECEVSTWMPTE
jgi:hypothetical protein